MILRDLAPHAERIRALRDVARLSIIEIGHELVAAKALVGHGFWLPWLEREFGWAERTARRYIEVAEAFKSATMADFGSLTIDASALYTLAKPDVPQEARVAAVAAAEGGEHVTKAASEAMVRRAVCYERRSSEDPGRR